jgi:glyoxylate/hydroxypyruvate reductase
MNGFPDMETVNVLVIQRLPDNALREISKVDSRLRVVDARGWFEGEIRTTWPQWTVDRYLGDRKYPETTLDQRNEVLASAEVALLGWPPLINLAARAPRLKWVHQMPAGASNLFETDLWQSNVIVTSSRGLTNKRPMAEYALASFLHFSRGLHLSYRDRLRHRLDHESYDPVTIRDKTVCIVGAGGIGQEVARLCAAAGMRVIGTRRRIEPGVAFPPGFARLEPAEGLQQLLGECEYVAICCPWTKESHHLLGPSAFSAMKRGTVLVNISRGEIIDEEALVHALAEGKLRGVALDVYDGEFERPPDARLWDDGRVIITPHVSAVTDVSEHQGLKLFCENLTRFLENRPLENVIDRGRGY